MAFVSAFQNYESYLATRLRAGLREIRRAGARRHAYRVTLKELSRLEDSELADIGISRFDIKQIARDSAAQI